VSPVESYLADLRTALGDRLPPAVHEIRMREARAHLLESAKEVDEVQAVRRYGRARTVANGLVRAHRGYEGRSAWSLASPLVSALVASGMLTSVLIVFGLAGDHAATAAMVQRCVFVLVALGFALRTAQTDRWLAGPMIAAHVAGAALLLLTRLAHGGSAFWSERLATFLLLNLLIVSAGWLLLNALALGTVRLLSLRRPRRAA